MTSRRSTQRAAARRRKADDRKVRSAALVRLLEPALVAWSVPLERPLYALADVVAAATGIAPAIVALRAYEGGDLHLVPGVLVSLWPRFLPGIEVLEDLVGSMSALVVVSPDRATPLLPTALAGRPVLSVRVGYLP